MWVDEFRLHRLPGPDAPSEARVAEVLAEVLMRASGPVTVVVDARGPGSTMGGTATYRLLAALELRRAGPVAVSAVTARDAIAMVEGLAPILPPGELALIVAAARDGGGSMVGACLLGAGPRAPSALAVSGLPVDAPGRHADGFVDLFAAVTALPSTRRTAG